MSEFENEQLSEMSNEDLEQQISDSEDELTLKPKEDDSDDSELEEDDEDNEDEENIEDDEDEVEEDEDIDTEENKTSNYTEPSLTENITTDINESYDSESESDDYDENEFKKLDNELKQDYLLQYHQESKIHNFDEIISMAKIIRNDKNVIVDELHKTIPILTKYEKTRILGERTKQINNGSKPFIEIENDIIDGYLVASKELEAKKIPFIIRRPLPSGGSEYWHLKDLEVI
jgi:DNA-directed RNA polymerase I, II, and III subunit RPABC2